MARKGCFEVSKLKFTFYSTMDELGKADFVIHGLANGLKKHASGTSCAITHKLNDVISPDVEVDVEFTRPISLNTVINILSHMVGDKFYQLLYKRSDKEVRISM